MSGAGQVLAVYQVGMKIAVTQHLLSKGATQGWCCTLDADKNIGMFAINLRTSFRALTDGSSNTLCVGEGTMGRSWKIADGTAPDTPLPEARGLERGMRKCSRAASWHSRQPSI